MKGPIELAVLSRLRQLPERSRGEILRSREELVALVLSEIRHEASQYSEPDNLPSPDLAARLFNSPAADWWDDDFDLSLQAHLSVGSEAPRWRPIENYASRTRASKPKGGLWTSSLFSGGKCAWSFLTPHRDYRMWVPSLSSTKPSVIELHTPEDWLTLCQTYPRTAHDGLLVPEWVLVAQDVDIIHLSMSGLLSIQSADLTVGDRVSRMEGWDAESSCWLRPIAQEWTLLDDGSGPR